MKIAEETDSYFTQYCKLLLLFLRFNEDIGITGAILTKMDGDTRGGSALSVRAVSGKPIKFMGVGEGMFFQCTCLFFSNILFSL